MRGRVALLVVLILLSASTDSLSKRIHKVADKLSKLAAQLRQRKITVDLFNETALLQQSELWYRNVRSREPRRLIQYEAKLGKIALYLRMYKRYGRNPQSNERRFVHQFPNPTVRQLDGTVQSACVNSVQKCVDTIYERIRRSYMFSHRNLSRIRSSDGPSLTEEAYGKLGNSDASFAFDTTAAYFMCWMTKKRLPLFRHPPFCAYPEQSTNFPELYGLDPRNYPTYINPDHALVDRLDPVPWRCAEISFCPDPCCGRENVFESGSKTTDAPNCSPGPQSCAWDDGVAEEANCEVPLSANSDLRAMIANEWNMSCACARPSFVYSLDSSMCIDRDECSELKSPCFDEHERCINVVGSHLCVCELGFERVTDGDRCSPIDVNVGSVVWHGPAIDAASKYPVLMSRRELPPTPSPSRMKWKTAYRVVQSFNRFKQGLASAAAIDVSSAEQQDETRAGSKRCKSKEPTPEPINDVDPVYLAIKQATGKYGLAKRRPSIVDSDHTPSPTNNLSQVSLQDSGYAGDNGSTRGAPNRGLDHGHQLGSTPLLKTQRSVEEQYQPDEPLAASSSRSKRPPRLDKSMKSLSLDCPDSSNPLSFSTGRKGGRPSLVGVGVVKKTLAGPRPLQQQLALPSRMLRKNNSIDASADDLDPRSSTSCSPCPSPLQAGSTNSLPAGSVYTVYVVTHEYRPPRLPEEFELLLGQRMIVVDTGDPDWYHGFKQGDRTETLISFPVTCVAGLWPNESVMKLVQNVSLSDGRKTLRLYRDQVVFAQPDTIHDGCVMVRTERNAKAMCPLHQLMLIDA